MAFYNPQGKSKLGHTESYIITQSCIHEVQDYLLLLLLLLLHFTRILFGFSRAMRPFPLFLPPPTEHYASRVHRIFAAMHRWLHANYTVYFPFIDCLVLAYSDG